MDQPRLRESGRIQSAGFAERPAVDLLGSQVDRVSIVWLAGGRKGESEVAAVLAPLQARDHSYWHLRDRHLSVGPCIEYMQLADSVFVCFKRDPPAIFGELHLVDVPLKRRRQDVCLSTREIKVDQM